MLIRPRFALAVAVLLCALLPGTGSAAQTSKAAELLGSKLPSLSSGPLQRATLAGLQKGVLLSGKGLSIKSADLDEEIAGYPASARSHLSKYRFFTLEQMAVRKFLEQEARDWASRNRISASGDELVRKYVRSVVPTPVVTDAEVSRFFQENRSMFESATFDQVKADVRAYLEEEKRAAAVRGYLKAASSRHAVQVSRTWAGEQYQTWIKNPVEQARRSGKPSLVDFGKDTCQPCRIMAPLLADLRQEYKGKLNVLFIHVDKEPVLAAHYEAEVIPMQVFYDKYGKEVETHVGLLNRNEINLKLKRIGIK